MGWLALLLRRSALFFERPTQRLAVWRIRYPRSPTNVGAPEGDTPKSRVTPFLGKSPRPRSSLLQCVRGAQPRRTAKQLEASMKFKTNYSIPQNTWLPMLKKWSSMSPQDGQMLETA